MATGVDCPCGLSGATCSELDVEVNSVNDVPDDVCFPDGFDKCLVTKGEAKCGCNCGWKGELCDVQIEPQLYNFSRCL